MKNNTTNKTLELEDLQSMLLSIGTYLNRPIRKSLLIKMVTDLFECNTQKQVDFAILDLIENKKLIEKNHFIVTPAFFTTWDGTVTAADEGIIKLLLSLKEDIKYDIFFSVYASECLTPSTFFKYIEMTYPALMNRTDIALSYMNQMDKKFPYGLSNDFYSEMNDYPTDRWFTSFFNNPDCRIIIKEMDLSKNHINLKLLLLPGKKRSYKVAYAQKEEFEKHIAAYFNNDIQLHIRTTLLTMLTGNTKKKHH